MNYAFVIDTSLISTTRLDRQPKNTHFNLFPSPTLSLFGVASVWHVFTEKLIALHCVLCDVSGVRKVDENCYYCIDSFANVNISVNDEPNNMRLLSQTNVRGKHFTERNESKKQNKMKNKTRERDEEIHEVKSIEETYSCCFNVACFWQFIRRHDWEFFERNCCNVKEVSSCEALASEWNFGIWTIKKKESREWKQTQTSNI